MFMRGTRYAVPAAITKVIHDARTVIADCHTDHRQHLQKGGNVMGRGTGPSILANRIAGRGSAHGATRAKVCTNRLFPRLFHPGKVWFKADGSFQK
ncbi:hypothetical protein NDU88_002450 [Pleurodeles waltl]|uniref:Uncharacterized protein n=1 Tax=Pleurodeles waltl TaxID=8319 RepID=A0AAV7TN52_PLEWA|nr:hypothetical protein NDU88_002450 [Pleurodeles waltl]